MNNKLEITGTCCHVGEVVTFSSGFQKRKVVVKDEKTMIAFDLKKDNVNLITESSLGHTLKATIFVDSREWDGPKGKQFFTDVTAVKVVDETSVSENMAAVAPKAPQQAQDDEFPF